MQHIALLKNTIQNYSWGSETAIAQLLGVDPVPGTPQAELWMGAHPKAPSLANVDGRWLSLEDLIAADPIAVLGKPAAERFGSRLPFLFKVLAAAQPLSLQAHPSREQARAGYERENRLGISLDAADRNYKDDNHKPECICALTAFWAMSGFRPVDQILQLLDRLQVSDLRELSDSLRKAPTAGGLKAFFHGLMTMPAKVRQSVAAAAAAAAENIGGSDPAFGWMTQLAKAYPGDIGVLSPVLLNLVELQPGEAVALPAGELHAYLEGVGIELMANSDNVLRGGLTPKHIDVAELLEVLHFEPLALRRLLPDPAGPCERVYASEFEEFVLSVITVTADAHFKSGRARSAEILLCTDGSAAIFEAGGSQPLPLAKGVSVLVPAAVAQYEITGDATFFKAAVPV